MEGTGTKKRSSTSSEAATAPDRAAKVARGVAKEPTGSSGLNQDDDSDDVVVESPALDFLEPIQPRPDVLQVNGGTRDFIIYMAIRENKTSPFSTGLLKCASICDDYIHQHCFQRDGTRHITMFQGRLTDAQVRELRFPDHFSFEPLELELEGWQPWKAGGYLKLRETSAQRLRSLLQRIIGLPLYGGKRPNDHLSLYRMRIPPFVRGTEQGKAFRKRCHEQFAKVRNSLSSYDFGSVSGVSIRLKELGTGYDECKVLAGLY